jgi:hypothetical protein
MDLEETEARIVEQLERILDAEDRLREIRWYISNVEREIPDTRGYYRLARAVAIMLEFRIVERELAWVKQHEYHVENEINDATNRIRELIPDEIRNMDIGFDVRNQRFHVELTYDNSVRIKHRRIAI